MFYADASLGLSYDTVLLGNSETSKNKARLLPSEIFLKIFLDEKKISPRHALFRRVTKQATLSACC